MAHYGVPGLVRVESIDLGRIGLADDADQLGRETLPTAQHPYAHPFPLQPAPFVLQKGLSDYYPVYELNAYTREPTGMAEIYSDLHASIQDALSAAHSIESIA